MQIEQLRQILVEQAQTGRPITYAGLADRLGLMPPQKIRRLTEALESLMAEDGAAGRPLLAAVCVSRMHAMPARGFFQVAAGLKLFSGQPDGEEARAFHAREFERAIAYYGQ